MAIVTPAILAALNTALQKNFRDAYAAMREQSFFERIATTVPSSTASNTYSWLGDFPRLREWVGDRVVKDMAAHGYEITNRLFEATLGVARTQIEDDQYGHYAPIAQHMGQEAAHHPDVLISAVLAAGDSATCYDGQYFFDTDHPVNAEVDGSGADASVSNITAGAAAPWYLLDTRKALKPFIFQERTKPELEMKFDPRTSDTVFTKDQYQWGIRYRCNAGYGFWQLAHKATVDLTGPNFEAARTAMRKVTADGGRPLGVRPNVIVVPSDLEAAADALFKIQYLAGGGSNPHYNAVEVIVDPWMVV